MSSTQPHEGVHVIGGGSDASHEPSLTLHHDFGLAKPAQSCEHEFVFRNETTEILTVERGKRACTCTVAAISSSTISPGESMGIKLLYVAQNQPSTDSRQVAIYFKERPAAPLRVNVEAIVRPIVYVWPEKVTVSNLTRGTDKARSIHVFNFGPELWDSIDVRGCPDWPSYQLTEIVPTSTSQNQMKASARQEWELTLTVHSHLLDSQSAEAGVELYPTGPKSDSFGTLEVCAAIEPLMQAFPSQLIIIPRSHGDHTRTFMLKLASEFTSAPQNAFSVVNIFDDSILVGPINGTGQVRRFSVSYANNVAIPHRVITIRMTALAAKVESEIRIIRRR